MTRIVSLHSLLIQRRQQYYLAIGDVSNLPGTPGNKTLTFVSRGHTYKAICERDGGDGSWKALLPFIGYHFLGWERDDKLALKDTADDVRWVFTIQSIMLPNRQKRPIRNSDKGVNLERLGKHLKLFTDTFGEFKVLSRRNW